VRFAFEEVSRCAEHASVESFVAVAPVEDLHGIARLGRDQRVAVHAVLGCDGAADCGLGSVALLGPQGAQQGVREARRIEPRFLRRDHHPARRLVPSGRLAVRRVMLRFEV